MKANPAPHLTALSMFLLLAPPALLSQEDTPTRSQPERAQPEAPPVSSRESRTSAPPPSRGGRSEARPERGRGAPPTRGEQDPKRAAPTAREALPREERRVSYIGVLTTPVSPEVRTHLRLGEGFGLRVVEVLRGSPAMAAGIQENDVLIRFEDQRLVAMEQLQALVREKRKGEKVKLSLVNQGERRDLEVEIGDTLVPVQPSHDLRRMAPPDSRSREERPSLHAGDKPHSPEQGGPPREGMDFRRHMDEWREKFEQQQKAWREWQERFRDWSHQHGKHFPPPPVMPGFSMSRPGAEQTMGSPSPERREASTITRSDDSGVYTLKKQGGTRLFTAQPKGGEPRTWNLDRENERRSIPENLRAKLGQLEELQRHEMRPREE